MEKKQMDYETKDSGERVEYASGMTRDIQDGKPDFSLLLADVPYSEQMLTRWAKLMEREQLSMVVVTGKKHVQMRK